MPIALEVTPSELWALVKLRVKRLGNSSKLDIADNAISLMNAVNEWIRLASTSGAEVKQWKPVYPNTKFDMQPSGQKVPDMPKRGPFSNDYTRKRKDDKP